MSSITCTKLCSSDLSTPLHAVFALALLATVVAVWINLRKCRSTSKLKLASKTSSFIVTRFKAQTPKDEPFMVFGLPYHNEHKDLNDVGSWAKNDALLGITNDWHDDTFASMEDLHPDLGAPLMVVRN